VIQDYRPGPSGFLHDFAGGDEFNDMVVAPGGTVRCFLQWNDPFGQSGNDYDLFLIERSTGTVVDSSTNVQDGLQDPKEDVSFVNPFASPLLIGAAVAKTVSAETRRLKLSCPDSGAGLQYHSEQGDVFGHPAVSEVIAVAAIGVQDPALSMVEAFSSRGPAVIFFPSAGFRPKPDLAAFDGVTTTVPHFMPFFGTSAAAPHSAAIAALLLSKNAALTPAQIKTALTSSAVDVGPAGFDAVSGAGRVDAFAAINAVSIPTTTTSTPTTTTSTSTTTPGPRCVAGGCDDGNPCTDDACDPATGCQHVPNAASCSDGAACTVGDSCVAGQCQPGMQATAGTVSTLITASVNASVSACRTDKRKVVKKVVNPLVQAAKAFSRAEVAGVGTKKWTKKISAGEKSIGNARSKLTKVQAKLSPPCVADLDQAVTAGALADACLR
jgi:hypothetical protein